MTAFSLHRTRKAIKILRATKVRLKTTMISLMVKYAQNRRPMSLTRDKTKKSHLLLTSKK